MLEFKVAITEAALEQISRVEKKRKVDDYGYFGPHGKKGGE